MFYLLPIFNEKLDNPNSATLVFILKKKSILLQIKPIFMFAIRYKMNTLIADFLASIFVKIVNSLLQKALLLEHFNFKCALQQIQTV